MSRDGSYKSAGSRTSSPSLTERVRSFTALRTRIPSNTRTVSADEAETETDTNVDSDDGTLAPERIRSDPGVYHDEQILHFLESSQPLAERVSLVERVSREARLYQFPTLMAVWEHVEDLATTEAPASARKALFSLAQASASHPGISKDRRAYLFSLTIHPIDSPHLESQTRCIRYITEKGTKLEPFSQTLVQYMKQNLERQYDALEEARKRHKAQQDRKKGQLPEERGLYSLFSLIVDVMQNSPRAMEEEDQMCLLDRVLAIIEKTGSRGDMKRAVAVLGVFVRAFNMPDSRVKNVVEIFCAISNAVPELGEETRSSLLFLLETKHQAAVVDILLRTLALSPQDRYTNTVCGALSVLRYLVESKGDRNLPTVSFARFIQAFWTIHFATRTVRSDCLKTISSLLGNVDLAGDILRSDWRHLIETILTATGDELYTAQSSSPLVIRQHRSPDHDASPTSEDPADKVAADQIYELLGQIATNLNLLWSRLSHGQRLLVARFYYELRDILPVESLDSLITAMSESRSLQPGSDGWQEIQCFFCEKLFIGRPLDPETYCKFIIELKQNVVKNPTPAQSEHYWFAASRLLEDFPKHQNGWPAADALAAFVVEVWHYSGPPDASKTLELLEGLLSAHTDARWRTNVDAATRSMSQANQGGVTVSLVDLFLQSLTPGNESISKQLYLLLVNRVAHNRNLVASARLPALKLLIRLRCNKLKAIFVAKEADSLGLAAALSRTEATVHTFTNRGERASIAPESSEPRKGRSSAYAASSPGQSKKSVRSPSNPHKSTLPRAPLWMYPGGPGLPRDPPDISKPVVWKEVTGEKVNGVALKMSEWLLVVIQLLQDETDWEVYSYVVVHLPSQLCNLTLFANSMPVLKHLRKVIVGQLRDRAFHEPPTETGVKKGDVALCLLHSLIILLGYCELFEDRSEMDDMVRTVVASIGEWEKATKTCVQALTVCCHVAPTAVSKRLPEILRKMSQTITQSQLSMDVLEFLAGLARLHELYADFREEDYRMIFAICVKYLEHSREQRLKLVSRPNTGREHSSNRTSGVSSLSGSAPESSHNVDLHRDLPQYVFVLAYHVLTVWFLSVPLQDRHKHVGWITKNLAWLDEDGTEQMEEQSQVTLDMMLRATYSDLTETAPDASFARAAVRKRSWLVGLSIVTMETDVENGMTQVTKRQASGTTHAIIRLNTTSLPPHHAPSPEQSFNILRGYAPPPNVFPNHVFLQLGATAAPTPIPMEPIHLPDDDRITRTMAAFDRNKTVDGFKVAVIYVANGQSEEREILANSDYTPAFGNFLAGIGTRVELKGTTINAQGLDTVADSDGYATYAWRDRLVEIVYHVPALMPTDLQNDPQCTKKKSHVGNDFVTIIFNDSGRSFNFDAISSEFNYVKIVVTPEDKVVPQSREEVEQEEVLDVLRDMNSRHYTVQVQSHASMPRISPAATLKMVPTSALPELVRQLALSSSIFCNVWANRSDGEYVSSWRNRLREINRLRTWYASSGTSTSVKYPGAKSTKTYSSGDAFTGRVQMGGISEEEGVSAGLDFSRWAGAPPA